MLQTRIPAVFMRGGTSKAVVFKKTDLPPDVASWDPIFLRVMGSPDPNGRQLNGMGGGISSLSKICVVSPSSREDADVDYTFAQISVRTADVDYSGNCGNMSSAIDPFSVDEGLVASVADGEVLIRIHNTNTGKIIHSRFRVEGGVAAIDGNLAIDGVAETGAEIKLEFRDPGGAKTGQLLPTGRSTDHLSIPGIGTIEASMVDAANPCVFVEASTLGKKGDESPEVLESDAILMKNLEAIRRTASVAMGIADTLDEANEIPSVPKIAMVTGPADSKTLSGTILNPEDFDIGVRMISIGQPHQAIPITGAVCLGVAARIPGTLAHRLAKKSGHSIRIAHTSGVVVVDAKVVGEDDNARAEYGAVYRTARRLFEGNVCYRTM